MNNFHPEQTSLQICPVCLAREPGEFQLVEAVMYFRCFRCDATFIHSSYFPDANAERTRYELHQNGAEDEDYRAFLSRLSEPLLELLPPHQEGLDYGCGPVPVLASMLITAGHRVEVYDPFFFPDSGVLGRQYDFITCSEVVEHMRRPAEEFGLFEQLLRRGGRLAIMTSFLTNEIVFEEWYYRRDPTHIVFFKENTFRFLAERFGWECTFPRKNIAFMHKPG